VPIPGRRLLAAAAAGTLVVSGCGSSHHRAAPAPASTTQPTSAAAAPGPLPSPVGEVSFALGAVAPSIWNVLAAGGAGPTLDQVAAQLWPSAFLVGPSYVPALNTALLTSASVVSESPQTVVYRINPSATWSDGVAITGQDFVYNWLAQSGQGGATDVGGRPFTPATTTGYSQVSRVVVAPLSPDVVTVRFSTPDPDWKSLFSYLMPAHVAQRIGFDSGFSDPVADLVSGGPYVVQSYSPGGQLRLVRNPSFWGTPATALALDFDFVPYTPQLVAALSAGQVDCAAVPATAATLLPLTRNKALSVKVASGAAYLDLDFREGTDALASASRRQAIVGVVDRQALTTDVVGAVLPGASPVANRFFLPGEPGYVAGNPGAVHAAPGSYQGPPLRLVSGSDPYSAAASRFIVAELRASGIDVSMDTVASVSKVTAGNDWDMAIESRAVEPFPGPATHAYAAGGSGDVDGVDSAQLTALVDRAAYTTGSSREAVIAEIDRLAWQDEVDLPLFALPIDVACQSSVVNVAPNLAPQGPAYNAQLWGLAGGPT
jgi:peptide/nickel transport system substrate-binding protein